MLIALLISTVSAYYSISGLMAIFSTAQIPIIIMGGALELGKVITTMWVRKNWSILGYASKSYLVACIIILMLVTSLGTFGFLSKSHLDQLFKSNRYFRKFTDRERRPDQ